MIARRRGHRGGTRAAIVATTAIVSVNALAVGGLLAVGALPFQWTGGDAQGRCRASTHGQPVQHPAAQTVAATIASTVPGFTGTADLAAGGGTVRAYPANSNRPRNRCWADTDSSTPISAPSR